VLFFWRRPLVGVTKTAPLPLRADPRTRSAGHVPPVHARADSHSWLTPPHSVDVPPPLRQHDLPRPAGRVLPNLLSPLRALVPRTRPRNFVPSHRARPNHSMLAIVTRLFTPRYYVLSAEDTFVVRTNNPSWADDFVKWADRRHPADSPHRIEVHGLPACPYQTEQ
jgi:hypothetical protein